MMMETYLRRGRKNLQRLLLDPRVRTPGWILAYCAGGFLLSAASLGNAAQPLALGAVCALTGWRAVLLALGAMAGYPTFWGSGGSQGIVWVAAGLLLVLLVGKREASREQPLMIPAIAAFLTGVSGLCFQLFLEDRTPLMLFLLRVGMTFFSGVLFTQAARCRDALTDWLVMGLGVLVAIVAIGVLFYLL